MEYILQLLSDLLMPANKNKPAYSFIPLKKTYPTSAFRRNNNDN